MKSHCSNRHQLDRRQFLRNVCAGLGGLGLLNWSVADALAATESTSKISGNPAEFDFVFSRLKFTNVKSRKNSAWKSGYVADNHMLINLRKHVNINVPAAGEDGHTGKGSRIADLSVRKEVFEYPFLFMTDQTPFDLPPDEFENLKAFLERGGFLYADECVAGAGGDYFFRDFMPVINRMFPGNRMKRLPDDHPINRCYFKFDSTPLMQGSDHGSYGLYLDGRLAVFLTPGDLHCGWWQTNDGWFGPGSFEKSVKMGANIVVFALTQQGRIHKS
ncbi:MAG: DUF4159 domain-containing protein [Lentisphaerae bacterium]|nr:DUF4159 domain-containing protein [Lentisphaerota bacterium]